MGKAIAEFVVGAAVILSPQHQIPLLLGSAALKLGSSIFHQDRKAAHQQRDEDENGASDLQQLTITWKGLSVAVPSKKTKKPKTIFENLAGSAKSGR